MVSYKSFQRTSWFKIIPTKKNAQELSGTIQKSNSNIKDTQKDFTFRVESGNEVMFEMVMGR